MNFVKDNSVTFIERKLSFEKKKPVQSLVSLAAFMTMINIYLPCLNHIILFSHHLSHSNML